MTDRSKDEDFAVLAKYEVINVFTDPRRSSASVNAEGAMWHRKIMQAHESGHPRSHLVC